MVEMPTNSPKPDLPPGWEAVPDSARPAILTLWQQNRALSAEVERLQAEIENLRASILIGRWLSHPLVALFASLGAMLALVAFVIIDNGLGVNPERHAWFLYYMVPIAAPLVAFLLDRAARLRELRWMQWAIDLPVIILGLIRAVYPLPGVSGHALFLTYAILTTHSRVAQVLSVIVLAEVIYLKLIAWHDPTLFGGVLIAILVALLFHLSLKQFGKKWLHL